MLAEFQRMTELDIPAVMRIEKTIYYHPWTEGIFKDCIQVGYDCWVLLDRQLQAYGVMSIAVGEAHLLNVSVAIAFQNSGIGTRLVKRLLAIALEKNANTAFLEVRPSNAAAIHLYQKLGFVEVGIRKDYYPARGGREDAVIYAKNIFKET